MHKISGKDIKTSINYSIQFSLDTHRSREKSPRGSYFFSSSLNCPGVNREMGGV